MIYWSSSTFYEFWCLLMEFHPLFFLSFSFLAVVSRFSEPAVWCRGKVCMSGWRDRGEVWQMWGWLPFAGPCRVQVSNVHKNMPPTQCMKKNLPFKIMHMSKRRGRCIPPKQRVKDEINRSYGHQLHKSSLFCSSFPIKQARAWIYQTRKQL